MVRSPRSAHPFAADRVGKRLRGGAVMSVHAPAKLKYISADTHVVEPADLWLTRADAPYRDRVPRIDSRPDGDYRVIPGLPEWRVSGGEGAMADTKLAGETITKERVYRYAEQRPGAS